MSKEVGRGLAECQGMKKEEEVCLKRPNTVKKRKKGKERREINRFCVPFSQFGPRR